MTAREILDDIESCIDEKQQIGLLRTYARLQIEKDRKEAAMEFISKGLIGSADMVTARPINLD